MDALANVILNNCNDVSNKKLQKLSYYVCAWHLAIYGNPLSDITFEAWEHGPVCRPLYNRYRRYGWHSIPRYEGFVLANDSEIRFIQAVLNIYETYSADALEILTHEEEPWIEARRTCVAYGLSNAQISRETMKNYYYMQQNEIKSKIEKYVA
jgi:uncharacterized phage-associated protein